ncbi:DUF6746 family protein [Ferrimonas marina]|uniref:Cytochrome b562 n=1 Tax=Ferrimonas marina TaxID=299255 RepID=A0A1M5NVF6_9GAMM|nr:DUF6746 family protein [Ferrimonas marina]SHG92963.1 hypothetical protein SAMN02745129_1177 [Ferrimonas marina]
MKKLITLVCLLALALPGLAGDDKPIQHLDLPEVTTEAEAQTIFRDTTAELKQKQRLDSAELQQIHLITYSLERSVAYFVTHSEGERQAEARELAELVEAVHLSSETNQKTATEDNLARYFQAADRFAKGF